MSTDQEEIRLLRAQLQILEEVVAQQKEELQALKAQVASTLPSHSTPTTTSNDPVRLDLCGKIFTITPETLRGTYFESMFSGRWPLKVQHDGSIFIERDPTYFRNLLNYMIKGHFDTSIITTDNIRQNIIQEAVFFGLDELVSELTARYVYE